MVLQNARLTFPRHAPTPRKLCCTEASAFKRLALAVSRCWQDLRFPLLARASRHQYGTSRFMSVGDVQGLADWLAGLNFDVAAYWLASAIESPDQEDYVLLVPTCRAA
jgi:hypothetical protein